MRGMLSALRIMLLPELTWRTEPILCKPPFSPLTKYVPEFSNGAHYLNLSAKQR